MNRKKVDAVKAEAKRLLERIAEMERCAGWSQWTQNGNAATSKPHPEDSFNTGKFTAAVRRASMDTSKALAELRKY